jgi:hypothetical protein
MDAKVQKVVVFCNFLSTYFIKMAHKQKKERLKNLILDTYTYNNPWPAKQVRDLLFNKTNCLRDSSDRIS